MSQHDYILANADGATFRADANSALAALVGQNSGLTAPATMFAYMLWADTTTGLLKQRNAANSAWVTVRALDAGQTEGTWTPADGSGAGLSLTLNGSQFYIKIGKLVFVTFDITYPSTASGAQAIVSGLPFTLAATTSALSVGYCSAATGFSALAGASATTITFHTLGSATNITNVNLTTARMRVSGCYQASA